MTTLVTIAPKRQLAVAPAASYNRCLVDGLPEGGINSAYRSTASQEAIFFARYKVQWVGSGKYGDVKWYKGKRYVRQWGLPVAVPGTSAHNKGYALDISVGTPQHDWFLKHGERHGWFRPLPKTDPVHWEYVASKDADRKERIAARKKVKAAQKALRVPLSEINDAATRKAARAVESANDSPPTFPSGVKYAQTHSGTKADDRWGPASVKANRKTVGNFQKAIGATVDYIWGAGTTARWAVLTRKAK